MLEFFINIFDTFLYRPLFNFLVLLYNFLPGHDFGVAIIILTVIIRLILYPSSIKSIKSQKALADIRSEIQEIQKKHKDDKNKQAKETIEIYKKAKVNPFGGCLSSFIQLPILIALYRVFGRGFKPEELTNLYKFVFNPGQINSHFLGIVDLAKPNIVLAVLAGIFQFFQTKTLTAIQGKSVKTKSSDFSQTMQKQMLYFFPVFTFLILLKLPSALGFYWAISSLLSIIQQHFFIKKYVRTE